SKYPIVKYPKEKPAWAGGNRIAVPGRILLWLFALALLPAALLLAAPRIASAQTQQFHMNSYDSSILINQDGSLDIVEILTYVYDSGSFHRGTRYWLTNRFDNISNIQVAEIVGGQISNNVELIN